jgi:hypothetical protein
MLYGIIAAVDQILISNGALISNRATLDVSDFVASDFVASDFVALDAACARPRARAPDRPSTR